MICIKCNEELIPQKVNMEYLEHRVSETFLVCPKCGNLFIPEDVAQDRMKQLEEMLEDK
jgi:uncharacterized protein with PIN domain